MRHSRTDDDRFGSLIWGIGLVLVGTVILLQYLDVMPFSVWREWWPLLIMVVGVAKLASSRTPHGIGSGVTTLLIGAWCYVATNHVYGLRWDNSWPLSLVAAGMGMVARSVAAAFMGRGDGVGEVKIDG
jgi:hypothetical protein